MHQFQYCVLQSQNRITTALNSSTLPYRYVSASEARYSTSFKTPVNPLNRFQDTEFATFFRIPTEPVFLRVTVQRGAF
jgi:hypothetical protein